MTELGELPRFNYKEYIIESERMYDEKKVMNKMIREARIIHARQIGLPTYKKHKKYLKEKNPFEKECYKCGMPVSQFLRAYFRDDPTGINCPKGGIHTADFFYWKGVYK